MRTLSRVSHRSSRFLFLACAILILTAPSARARDRVDVRTARPNAIRGRVAAVAAVPFGPHYVVAGLTYSRHLAPVVAFELFTGAGSSGRHDGPAFGAALRFTLLGTGHSNGLTLALGADGTAGGGGGRVELAWELRTSFGLDMVVGAGLGFASGSSHRCDTDTFCSASGIGPSMGAEIGWTF